MLETFGPRTANGEQIAEFYILLRKDGSVMVRDVLSVRHSILGKARSAATSMHHWSISGNPPNSKPDTRPLRIWDPS